MEEHIFAEFLSNGTPKIQTLSFDLHLGIIHFLNPLSIISLRQTCKTFYETSKIRLVWTNALLDMCYQNTVLIQTFPMTDMSLLELEKAATAPARMLSKMGAFSVSTCTPRQLLEEEDNDNTIKVLHPIHVHYIYPEEHEVNFDTLFLVPGGRFLITGSLDGIRIWDLNMLLSPLTPTEHAPREGTGRPVLIAAWSFPLLAIMAICPTEDLRGLRLVIEREQGEGGEDEPAQEIVVIEYRPKSSSRDLAPLEGVERILKSGETNNALHNDDLEGQQSEEHETDFGMYTVSGNHFVGMQLNHHRIFVWNFIEDTSTSWDVPWEVVHSTILMLEKDIIICIGRNQDITGWRIPPLESRSSTNVASRHSEGVFPLFTTTLPVLEKGAGIMETFLHHVLEPEPCRWKRVSDWYPIHSANRLYDRVYFAPLSSPGKNFWDKLTNENQLAFIVETHRILEGPFRNTDPSASLSLTPPPSTLSESASYPRPEYTYIHDTVLGNTVEMPMEMPGMDEPRVTISQSSWRCNTGSGSSRQSVEEDAAENGVDGRDDILDVGDSHSRDPSSTNEEVGDGDDDGQDEDHDLKDPVVIHSYRMSSDNIIKTWSCINQSTHADGVEDDGRLHLHVNSQPASSARMSTSTSVPLSGSTSMSLSRSSAAVGEGIPPSTFTSTSVSAILTLAPPPAHSSQPIPMSQPSFDEVSFDPVSGRVAHLIGDGFAIAVLEFI